MEITLEQVEKVRGCTGVSYEEAKAALEECGGSVLDAVILLEQRGKAGGGPAGYSTRGAPPDAGQEGAPRRSPSWPEVRRALTGLLSNCLSITLEIWRESKLTCVIPLLIALILCVVEPWLMFALAAAGVCLGYRVHIAGRGTEEWGGRVNQMSDRLGDTVHDAVSSLRKEGKKIR